MIRNKLNLFKIQQDIQKNESLIPHYYEIMKAEFIRVEKQLLEDYLQGIANSTDLEYRNVLNEVLSTQYSQDVEGYNFFDKYNEELKCN
ncbi:MAG: hypothetical protein JSS63_09520 [Bacteroidetes bacterium]|nr:hypothetical protein [Bacteroidota bacterium]